jgi:transposase
MGTKHYQKEIFRPLLFCNGMYQIGTFGNLKSVYRISKYGLLTVTGLVLKLNVGSNGYYRKNFEWFENGVKKKKRVNIHRLVVETFLPNPENKPCVNHKDCNKLNNHISNLEWCTVAENNYHAKINDLMTKIPKETREYIKSVYNGYNKRQLAKQFNISAGSVYVIGTNRDGRGYIRNFERVRFIGMKPVPKSKVVINTETGEKLTAKQVSEHLGKSMKETYKILGNYNGKVNNTKYKYGEGYIYHTQEKTSYYKKPA